MPEEVYGNPRRRAIPLLLLAVPFVLGPAILLLLVTFSTPFSKSIYFLTNNRTGGAEARFGVFGWCVPDYCLPRQLGYPWYGSIPAGTQLTKALVLFPVSAALSLLATFLLLATIATRKLALPTLVVVSTAFLASALAVIFMLCIFLSTKVAFDTEAGPGPGAIKASYGPAFWMSVAASAALMIGSALVFFGGLRALRREVQLGYYPPAVPAKVTVTTKETTSSGGGFLGRFRKS